MAYPTPVNAQPGAAPATVRRTRTSPGIQASLYAALFLAGLYFVSGFVTTPSYPAADTDPAGIVAYFRLHPDLVRVNAFLSFGAAMVLGILAVSMVSQLRSLGAVNTAIVLFAGLATACDQIGSHSVEWALTWAGIAQDATLTQALFYLSYMLGGPGFSLPMGLFVGSLALGAASRKLLPRWLIWSGIALGAVGLLSWFNVLLPTAFPFPLLIPLTRFPAFVWLILVGFLLPNSLAGKMEPSAQA